MRSFNRAAVGVAMVAGTTIVGAGATIATVPPEDDEGALPIEQFIDLAERAGYTLVDPACSTSPEPAADLAFTCYAMTTDGDPFVVRTRLSPGDVIEFEILAQPGAASDPATPQPDPAADETTATVEFDPLAYFDAMFSGDAAQVVILQQHTAPGSPAEAYALYQAAFAETIAAFGGEVESSHVYLTANGVIVCLAEGDCVDVTDMEVIDGRLADFAVDGNEIAPRLGWPGDPVTVDPATAAIRAAYRSVSGGDALRIYVEVSSNADATFELSNAVYVDGQGNLTPVDRETSIGAVDGSARVPTTVALDFPNADPGGELRFLVFPRGATAPLAVVLPVDPVLPDPSTTDDV